MRDATAVPCVALSLTSPGPVECRETRDAVIQTRNSPVHHFASQEGPQTPKEQSQLELTSTSVFEETPGAQLTFDLGSEGSPGVPVQLDASLIVDQDDDSQVSASGQSGRTSRCLDRRPGARRESEGRDEEPAPPPRLLRPHPPALQPSAQPRYPVKRRYWT